MAKNLLSKLFGGSAKAKPKPKQVKRRAPERKLAPVAEIVEQGLLVANVAARMAVKNDIIMNALRRNVDFEQEAIEELTRQKLQDLAKERGKDAKHIVRVREEIKKYGRSAWRETEYGHNDNRTLKHRQEVYERLCQELKQEAQDSDFVAKLAFEARDQAWAEIGDSLKEKASHPYYSGGSSAEYQSARDERIKALIEQDIAALLAGGSTKKKLFGK